MSVKVSVIIDREECISCGNCWTSCPEFFEESGDDGKSEVVPGYRKGSNLAEGEAPEDLRNGVTTAAEECPVSIIHVG